MPRNGVREQTAYLRASAASLAEAIAAETPAPAAMGRPCLVLLIGLPASGKSHVARLLAERVGAITVASDALRRRLFIAASYTPAETTAVFALAHELARRLLLRGHVVILDATSLQERQRAPLYAIARDASAPLVLIRVVASEAAIKDRLGRRGAGASPIDASDADWSIYQMMRERYEEPTRPYLTIDTSGDLDAELARAVEAIRLACV